MNELLQALSALAHVAQNFALAIADRSQLLALQKFDIAVQNRKRRLQIVRGGAESVGGAMKTLAKIFVFLQQILGLGTSRIDAQRQRRRESMPFQRQRQSEFLRVRGHTEKNHRLTRGRGKLHSSCRTEVLVRKIVCQGYVEVNEKWTPELPKCSKTLHFPGRIGLG